MIKFSVTKFSMLLAVAFCASCGAPAPSPVSADQREAAYRANNQGVAFLEQFAYDRAVGAFRQALELDPSLRIAEINLPIALYYAGMNQEAASRAAATQERYPDAPQPPYMLGLIARAENRPADAVNAFLRVLQIDPEDVGARVNLALEYVQQRKYAEAAALCEEILAIEPYNATAAYNLGVALTRAGKREEGLRALERFEQLRDKGYAVTYSQTYLEQGRYAEAVASTGAEAGLVNTAEPAVVFSDATASLIDPALNTTTAPAAQEAGVTLVDIDADNDLDVISAGPRLRVLRNDRSRFVEITQEVGLALVAAAGAVNGVAAGDLNNDTRPDLLLLALNGPRLFAQEQGGRFREVDARSVFGRQAARSAALTDLDHDGDLDVLIGGLSAPVRALRNNGNGTFADVTAATGLGGASAVVALAPTDFDNRRDIDVLAVSVGARPKLFRNLRDGSFADVAASVGLPDADDYASLAVGDVNKDGFADAFFGKESTAGTWVLSDGRGRFRLENAAEGSRGATAAQIFDFDNDGLLDLFLVTASGPRLYRNLGRSWQEQTDRAFSPELRQAFGTGRSATAVATGDLDLDGDTDIVAHAPGVIRIWRNDGGNRNRSLRVRLSGRVSNRSGVGAKVEMRAGSLIQQVETASTSPPVASADILFGLGQRSAADVVRVLWPAGILQAETASGGGGLPPELSILELDRKPSSCPYLYTWNGSRYEFITDFMGGGEMGYWHAPGVRNIPDPDEYVRITDRQLRPRDGRYELRVTNELEEVLFVDDLRLMAVPHPGEVSVYPDEGLREKPRPFRLYAAQQPRALSAARDEHGHDVLPQLSQIDRRYVDDFELLPIRGYAREHTLVLDLPPAFAEAAGRTLLLLTGWTDYAFSSDNVAAHQAGLSLSPPALQVKDRAGRWRTVDADIGIPVGRPQTLVVDVTAFAKDSRQVRIVTNMRIYWDQILVATAGPELPAIKAETVPLRAATLRWRGFSAEAAPDGREPWGYDYARVRLDTPWKLMPGRYTREGDVTELIAKTDDRFVVSRPGDELALSFDASALPPLPSGARRTFLLYSVGYSKEMDWHSASPDEAAPLPFRGMTRYPYDWPERYPHPEDLERFHTRAIRQSIPRLH